MCFMDNWLPIFDFITETLLARRAGAAGEGNVDKRSLDNRRVGNERDVDGQFGLFATSGDAATATDVSATADGADTANVPTGAVCKDGENSSGRQSANRMRAGMVHASPLSCYHCSTAYVGDEPKCRRCGLDREHTCCHS
jgi:hypothetical protein